MKLTFRANCGFEHVVFADTVETKRMLLRRRGQVDEEVTGLYCDGNKVAHGPTANSGWFVKIKSKEYEMDYLTIEIESNSGSGFCMDVNDLMLYCEQSTTVRLRNIYKDEKDRAVRNKGTDVGKHAEVFAGFALAELQKRGESLS